MIAANVPSRRSRDARLLVVDGAGQIVHAARSALVEFLRAGDLVVANDAATLPASLRAIHTRSGREIEVRLAGRPSLDLTAVSIFLAVVFGAGDYHTPTEHRPLPPPLSPGDRLTLGPLAATIVELIDHPRLVAIRFDGDPDAIWAGIAHHGRPIQYAHVPAPLALWDVWTVVAGAPVAFEPPSAGFAFDWQTLAHLHAREIRFATITHAAGISSTGDEVLDKRLPFDEPYHIPARTAHAIATAHRHGNRVIAVGTTVVRALEHAALRDGSVGPGPGIATQRITAASRLSVVDAVLSGVHEPGTSHYELLRAFVDDDTIAGAIAEMNAAGYRTHEFGDFVLIDRARTAGMIGAWTSTSSTARTSCSGTTTRFHPLETAMDAR
jgi:S-adenosylmethionine:tRNA ribosyltransferase-isomerase